MKKQQLRLGLFFGTIMCVSFILRELFRTEDYTPEFIFKIILIGILCGIISGAIFGYIMSLIKNKTKK